MGRSWRAKVAGTVRSSTVVVPNVFREHHTQVPLAEDQYTVGEFGSDRAYEPFSETVRPRTTRRNPDYADADVREDSIEGRGELTGPISDEEPEPRDAIAKIHHKIADLLGSPLTVRVRGRAQQVHRPAADLQRKVGPGRGVGVSTGPFPGAPFRTRRMRLRIPGSPRVLPVGQLPVVVVAGCGVQGVGILLPR